MVPLIMWLGRDIQINQSLLQNVHVPKLSTNLISIHRLTKDLNCNVVFCYFHCVFQEHGTEKMIGRARERDGLYYLEVPSGQQNKKQFIFAIFSLKMLRPKKTRFGLNISFLICLRVGLQKISIVKFMTYQSTNRRLFQLAIKDVLFLFLLPVLIFGVHLLFLMFREQDGSCCL